MTLKTQQKLIQAAGVAAVLLRFTLPVFALAGGGDPVHGVIGDDTTFTPSKTRSSIASIIGLKANLSTPGGVLSALLPFLFAFGGIILFVMLVWGGFEVLFGAAEPKSQEAGKQRITAALLGFLLLFASVWIAQIVQIVFGINILNN